MNRLFLGAATACALLCPTLGFAHQDDDPSHTHDATLSYDYSQNRSPQYGVVELRFGPYIPNVDSEFSGATPYEDSFGDKPSLTVGFEVSYQALRIPYFGTLGPGVGLHSFRKSGIAEFTDGSSGSAHTNRFWVMPMYGVGVLRVDVLARELRVPLVPYVKGGFAWALWESRDAREVSVHTDGTKARGLETGLQAQLGLMLLLNPIAPQSAIDMDNSTGVNNAYLFGEWWMCDIDSFNTGMQVGASTWVAGLALEF